MRNLLIAALLLVLALPAVGQTSTFDYTFTAVCTGAPNFVGRTSVQLLDDFDNPITSVSLWCSRGKLAPTWGLGGDCTPTTAGCGTRAASVSVTTNVAASQFFISSDVFNTSAGGPGSSCSPQLLFNVPLTYSCGFLKPKQTLTVHID